VEEVLTGKRARDKECTERLQGEEEWRAIQAYLLETTAELNRTNSC